MSKFRQNIVSARFLEVLDELIDKQIVESHADFCRKVGYPAQSLSQIKLGKRDVTIDLVSKLLSDFRGNPVYLFSGKGSKVWNEDTLSLVQEEDIKYPSQSADSKTVQTLEELVSTKDELIKLLKEKVAALESKASKKNV